MSAYTAGELKLTCSSYALTEAEAVALLIHPDRFRIVRAAHEFADRNGASIRSNLSRVYLRDLVSGKEVLS